MSELALKLIREAKETKAKKLDLGNCGLTKLPDELFELVWLEELYLSTYGWLYNFKTKEKIKFESKNIGGRNFIQHFTFKIQQLLQLKILLANAKWGLKDLSPLKNLENLQQLNVSQSKVKDLAPLITLENLQWLDVSSTKVNDLSPMAALGKLQWLNVSRTNINDLSPLLALENLQWLNVSRTNINDLNPVAALGNLQWLNVSSTKINDLNPVAALGKLQWLDVSNTKINDLGPLAILENLKQLNVFQTQVNNISPLVNLKKIEHLNVSKTKVSDLNSLVALENLKYLNVSETQVSDLSSLVNLRKIENLNVSETIVNDLGPLVALENLKHLNVSETKVSDLSPLNNLIYIVEFHARFIKFSNLFFLNKFEELEKLGLGNNGIFDINPLSNCKKLKFLYLWDNPINDLRPLQNLENLEALYIRNSQISNLQPLKKLAKLSKLSLSGTQISDLVPLMNLENLEIIHLNNTQINDLSPLRKVIKNGISVNWQDYGDAIRVKNCPLKNPPIEIVKQGNEAILNYWEQIDDQGGTETINEAKLIIVGEGDTGKTTLFNKLIDPDFDLSKTPTEETQGINIHEGLEVKDEFRANLWDFGGQELQYMTHQFFLTPNAVYVLMMAARGEAPNLAYWFKIIRLLGKDKSGGKVSLIIVLNKRQGSTGMPQYQDLLKIYEDDFDYQFIEVDFAVNDSRWDSLKESIEQRLINLPIVKNELPKQWNPIRETLREEAQKKPYIDASRLETLCEPYEVVEQTHQFLMTNYLHELGSLLHFQGDEDDLIDLIVLSPEWVVEGVYTVLKNERIKKELQGKFTKKDMKDILCASHYELGGKEKKYTRVDAEKLIQLMSKNNFDICYKSGSGKYVAAQLLPSDRPSKFIWNKSKKTTLQFRYRYPIMPKGLMSRLIVRLSDHLEVIDRQEIVWKKGAILRMDINGSVCRVLMREDDGESRTGLRQIIIEVLEDNPPFTNRKYALQKVRDEIDSLHNRWFKNITFEQIIPCNCVDCKDRDDPETYELTKLLKLKKGRAYCNVQEEFVPLQQLLEGVYEPAEIESFERNKNKFRPD